MMDCSSISALRVGPNLLAGLKNDTLYPSSHTPFGNGNILNLYLDSPTAVNQPDEGWTVELDRHLNLVSLEDERAVLGYTIAAFAAITAGYNQLTERVRVGLEHRVHMKQHDCNAGYIPGVLGLTQFRVLELRDFGPVRVDSECPECSQSVTDAEFGTDCQGRI